VRVDIKKRRVKIRRRKKKTSTVTGGQRRCMFCFTGIPKISALYMSAHPGVHMQVMLLNMTTHPA
jgi:hypothetical protein